MFRGPGDECSTLIPAKHKMLKEMRFSFYFLFLASSFKKKKNNKKYNFSRRSLLGWCYVYAFLTKEPKYLTSDCVDIKERETLLVDESYQYISVLRMC